MIIDRLDNSHLYVSLHPRIKAAFDYLQKTDMSAFPAGKYEIDGLNLYAMLQQYDTKPKIQGVWEAHRRYIDLQAVLQGTEILGYANIARLMPGTYDPAKDFLPLSGEGDSLTLQSGSFVLLFPEDAHMPGIAIDSPQPVKKIVVKIAVFQAA
jgi:YhcH/YjgK/YiaL family protein